MSNGKWVRWVPAIALPAIVIGGAVAVPLAAGAAVSLPGKSAAQVLELAASSSVTAFSGTIEQTSDLGLPDLSGAGSSATDSGSSDTDATQLLSMLTGSHTSRVYVDGATKQRVQLIDSLAETDVVRNGSTVWTYDSKANSATEVTLPVRATSGGTTAPEETLTPSALANKFLSAAKTSATVTVGTNEKIAGRPAYELILKPTATDSLVSSVSVYVDAQTGLPLRTEIIASGQSKPAFAVGFTDLTIGAPSGSLFTFTPPKGATVKHEAAPTGPSSTTARDHKPTSRPTIIGSGWDAVVEYTPSEIPARLTSSPLFAELTESVSGGHVLSTTLVNVYLTADGRVFAGSVPVSRLQAVAAQ